MRSVRQHARLIDDLDVRHYLESLGQRLAAGSKAPKRQYSFFMVDDASINAFAGPGGYIGVHTGLFMAAKNESELAGVLAHEIAHVTQRHLVRAYEASNRLGLPTAAAMIAAILLGAATGSDGRHCCCCRGSSQQLAIPDQFYPGQRERSRSYWYPDAQPRSD